MPFQTELKGLSEGYARPELLALEESALFPSNRIRSASSSYLRTADSFGEEKPACTIQLRRDSPESNLLTADLTNTIGNAIILNNKKKTPKPNMLISKGKQMLIQDT